MQILSVALKNFKSHSDRVFSFQPGTNAICGENGAGKTSILEAIAWVLFDYKGRYRVEDLIRNGANSAQARVTFISNRDQRTYEVGRCTRAGYTIFDPQLGQKLDYTRIDDEVMPWLRQHFGVTAGTDLGSLFANTIGIPQGTFTADFLRPDKDRKQIFDKILKVDEYRQAFDKLLPLGRYAESTVKDLEKDIAYCDEQLADLEALMQKRQQQQQELKQVQTELQQQQALLSQLHLEQTELLDRAQQMQQLENQRDRLFDQVQTQTQVIEQLQRGLQQAEQAVAICTQHRPAFQTFQQAEEALSQLEQQRRAEAGLQQEKRKLERQLGDRQTQLATLTHQLHELTLASTELEQLQPAIEQQLQLEQAQASLNQQQQSCLGWQQMVQVQEKQRIQNQTRQAQVQQDIVRLQALKPIVQQIPLLEQQQNRWQQQLSRIEAAAQFEADLQQIVEQSQSTGDRYQQQVVQATAYLRELQQAVPVWAEVVEAALETLHSGATSQQQLLSSLHGILDDLAEQTSASKLEQQLRQTQLELQTARQRQTEFANLDSFLQRQQELFREAAELETSLQDLRDRLQVEPRLQQQQAELEHALQRLGDPRRQSRWLQQRLQQLSTLQTQAQTSQTTVNDLQQAIAGIDGQLLAFADLPEQLQIQQDLKEQHRAAYQEYLAYRELANTRREKYQQVQAQREQLQSLEENLQAVTEQRDRLRAIFDPDRFQTVQTTYQQVNHHCIALQASLPDKLKRLEDLEQQLAKLEDVQTKRQQTQAKLTQAKTAERFIKFARKAYKEAGPRITERYLQSISREADKLFRELLNRPNVALEWTRDYEILVQEGAHTRRFFNLSGGEQMCAALAVRLALLKVLADIDIAFFDEPTTNMDRPRRESLAEAIANIKTFRQLFVISHDDTFEKVTENIILVQREA